MTTDQDGHIFRIIIFGFVARGKENESRWSKGKGFPLLFLSNTGGGKIWLHSFLTLALHGGQWPPSHICPFTLGNELVPITWKAGWLPEPISAVRTLYEYLAPSCKDGCAVCSPVLAQTVVQSAAMPLHKQLCSLPPCPCTDSCAICSPVPAQTVVQSAALSLHKLHHRDALNHPVATVLFVYHKPQINVWPVTVATELHIRQIFSEQLGTLRNTNLQRTPGQTVWISAQSSCTLCCHNMWTAPPDPFGGKANLHKSHNSSLKCNGILCGCPSDAICLESRPASRSVRIAPRIDDVITQRRVTAPCAADSFRSSIDTQHLSRSSCRARELPVVDRGKTQTRWSGISTVSSHRECRAVAVHAIRRVEIQLH